MCDVSKALLYTGLGAGGAFTVAHLAYPNEGEPKELRDIDFSLSVSLITSIITYYIYISAPGSSLKNEIRYIDWVISTSAQTKSLSSLSKFHGYDRERADRLIYLNIAMIIFSYLNNTEYSIGVFTGIYAKRFYLLLSVSFMLVSLYEIYAIVKFLDSKDIHTQDLLIYFLISWPIFTLANLCELPKKSGAFLIMLDMILKGMFAISMKRVVTNSY